VTEVVERAKQLSGSPAAGALSPEAAQDVAALNAAMRKLGFAAAQVNAAGTRLALASQKAQEDEPSGPSVDLPNADSYLRHFRLFLQASQRQASERDARQERVESAQAQYEERSEQAQAALMALSQLVEGIELRHPAGAEAVAQALAASGFEPDTARYRLEQAICSTGPAPHAELELAWRTACQVSEHLLAQ
ncbi:MAG: hypothetical protein ACREMY_17225, partial [bacterium]